MGSVAVAAGVPDAGDPVDARDLPAEPARLADAVERHAVFGRVTPQQKRAMVAALRSRGHTVAMTGDGVNDVLALIARPYTWWRAGLVAAMVAGFVLVAVLPTARRFFALDYGDWTNDAIAVAIAAVAAVALVGVIRAEAWLAARLRWPTAGTGRSGN